MFKQHANLLSFALIISTARHGFTTEGMEYKNATAILERLLQNYDKHAIPYIKGNRTEVTIQIYLSDMVPLNSLHMHFSMEFFLRQEWKDERLTYEVENEEAVLILPGEMRKKIWIPDLYFPTGKDAKQYKITTLNGGIHLYSNGRVFSSERLSLTSFCPMDLTYFPFDVQTCYFSILSYAYQSDLLHLKWKMPNPVLKSSPEAPLYMREFKRVHYLAENDTEHYTDIGNTMGNYSALKIKFKFYRDIQTHVLRDYVPCLLTVTLSWISFWIDYRSSPSRVALGVTTVLAMVTLSSAMIWRLPSGSEFRSVDLYLLICNTYVFAVVIEFAFVCMNEAKDVRWTKKKRFKKDNSKNNIEMSSLRQSNGNPVTTEHQSDLDVSFSRRAKKKPSSSHVINQLSTTERNDDESKNRENIKDMGAIYFEVKGKLKTHHIDRYCRVFFPASFVFLNSCYLIFHFIKYDRSDRDIN